MVTRQDEFVDGEMVDSICKIIDKSLNPVELEKVYKHCEYRLYEIHDPRPMYEESDSDNALNPDEPPFQEGI